MSNSALVDIVRISPNSSPRTEKIDTITIHHMACKATAEACAASFQPASRKASANYCIGYDGSVALSVDESRRAWTSSNAANDQKAITIEVSNDGGAPDWHIPDAAMEKLIQLCVDICQRNGIERLRFTGDTSGNMTMHKWFASTACPGPYLESKFPYIAEEVNKRLGVGDSSAAAESKVLYRVQVGAYAKEGNAKKQLEKVKAAGFTDAFIVKVAKDV